MFKILELKGGGPTAAVEVGHGYSTREKAVTAVKMYLKTFKGFRTQLRGELLMGSKLRVYEMLDIGRLNKNWRRCSAFQIEANFDRPDAPSGSGAMTMRWSVVLL